MIPTFPAFVVALALLLYVGVFVSVGRVLGEDGEADKERAV